MQFDDAQKQPAWVSLARKQPKRGKVGASGTKVDAKAVMWQKYPFLLLRDTRKPLASALKSGARQVSTLEGEKLLV
jgi:hypothetical protein